MHNPIDLKHLAPEIKKGMGFGVGSGVLTTLGLLTGLTIGTQSKIAVVGGILTIAFADALADAFGMHMSQETQAVKTNASSFKTAITTFLSKFLFSLTFLIPILLLDLMTAFFISIVWGMVAISLFSYYIAKEKGLKPLKTIVDHLLLAIFVLVATYLIGIAIRTITV